MEIWVPPEPLPIAKVKRRKGKKFDNLLMENMEIATQRREANTIFLQPNRVARTPPIKEKRRYPIRMPPLKSPISK
jgi:hypothetical protein